MIGVFGSAFNPPTKGHAFVIKKALLQFSRVIAVPSYDHCFGKMMAPFDVRMALTEAFVKDLNDSRVEVSDVEERIWTGDPVSSYEVLTALRKEFPGEEIKLIIGQDNAEQFHRFKNHERILKEYGIFVISDAGPKYPRSTEIRRRISASEDVGEGVTESVSELLKANHEHFIGI